MSSTKNRKERVVPPISVKLKALKELSKGDVSERDIAKDLNVHLKTLRSWKKNKKNFLKLEKNNDGEIPKTLKQTHKLNHEAVDKLTWLWFKESKKEGIPITGTQICKQARAFHKALGHPDKFSASNGWLEKFKKRHNIKCITTSEEKSSSDTTSVENLVTCFDESDAEENLSTSEMFTCNETDMNFNNEGNDTNKKEKKRTYERFKYSEQDMQKALESCRKGMPLSQVSKAYNIPKSTLHAKVTEKVPEDRKMGPKSILTKDEELRLETWIINKGKRGFPMHPDEVRNAVQHMLQEVPRENPFTNNKPGIKWFQLFLKRHPSITEKNAEVLAKSRAGGTEESLRKWFKETENFLKDNNVLTILERPHSIFNNDEITIQLCLKSGISLTPKDEKHVHEVAPETEKESITVICTFSAAGEAVPPMIIYPYKRIPGSITELVPSGWPIGKSESGCMTSSTFFEYIANIFYPWCLEKKVEFPVIFFIDRHKAHVSLELNEFCVEKKIILYCFPPNSTHIIQPCEVSIFKPLNAHWKSVAQEYKQETGKIITKTTFAPLFKKAFDRFLNENIIKNSFQSCGLYPFDENAVDYSKCIPRKRVDLSFSSNEESISTNNLMTVKNTIEYLIGNNNLQRYFNLKKDNESYSDPLYTLWKLCANHMGDTSVPVDVEQFRNLVSNNLSKRNHKKDTSTPIDVNQLQHFICGSTHQ